MTGTRKKDFLLVVSQKDIVIDVTISGYNPIFMPVWLQS